MNFLNVLITSVVVFFLLHIGKFIFIPLFFSLFFYVILNSISNDLIYVSNKINIKINESLAHFMLFSILIFFVYFLFKILKVNVTNVIENIDLYQDNLNQLLFYFSKTPLENLFNELIILKNFNLMNIFTYLLNIITNFAGNFSMIFFLLIFLVIEKKFLKLKVTKIIKKKNKLKVFSNINNDIYNYFRIKSFTSFLTGIFTFVILILFNSDLAIAFGILSFFLNFIPYIGSLTSIMLPVIFSIVENFNFIYSIIILVLLFLVHILIGNFLENKLMGKALNISPMVLLIFLSIMGKLWGISGMFLSVPIIVVLIIILNNFEQTKNIAILLSEKGNLK
ncbi:MAG: hypothetical protein CMP38_05085 [Rickettsiales bacterium]|nr:hypothetical protein [Rickettsiales bacterium]|tara:strand:- start:4083 stop:5093 length:1011 start_codon:yes stop_codon:yes gene_type:complete